MHREVTLQNISKTKRIRIYAFLTTAIFVFSSVVYAMPVSQPAPSAVQNLSINNDLGRISESFLSRNNSEAAVLFIQDAHANYAAQKSIRRILSSLSQSFDIENILIEGMQGKTDLSLYKAYPLKAPKEKLLDDLIQQGKASGAEDFVINERTDIDLIGADNEKVYLNHLKTSTKILSMEGQINQALKQLAIPVHKKMARTLNADALAFISLKEAYENCTASPLDYMRLLFELSNKHDIQTNDLKYFLKLKQIEVLQKNIDTEGIQKETNQLLKTFIESDSINDRDLELLAEAELSLKSGETDELSFYLRLKELALKEKLDFRQYKNINLYYNYLRVSELLDAENVEKERQTLEKRITARIFTSKEARELFKLNREITLLATIFSLKAERDTAESFRNDKEKIIADIERSDIQTEAKSILIKSIDLCDDFYSYAEAREKVMAKTITQKATEDKNPSVFIAGGYHTAGITRLLRNKNISYAVITPSISIEETGNYEKIMRSYQENFGIREGINGGNVNLFSALGLMPETGKNKTEIQQTAATALPELVAAIAKHPARKQLAAEWNKYAKDIISGEIDKGRLKFTDSAEFIEALKKSDLDTVNELLSKNLTVEIKAQEKEYDAELFNKKTIELRNNPFIKKCMQHSEQYRSEENDPVAILLSVKKYKKKYGNPIEFKNHWIDSMLSGQTNISYDELINAIALGIQNVETIGDWKTFQNEVLSKYAPFLQEIITDTYTFTKKAYSKTAKPAERIMAQKMLWQLGQASFRGMFDDYKKNEQLSLLNTDFMFNAELEKTPAHLPVIDIASFTRPMLYMKSLMKRNVIFLQQSILMESFIYAVKKHLGGDDNIIVLRSDFSEFHKVTENTEAALTLINPLLQDMTNKPEDIRKLINKIAENTATGGSICTDSTANTINSVEVFKILSNLFEADQEWNCTLKQAFQMGSKSTIPLDQAIFTKIDQTTVSDDQESEQKKLYEQAKQIEKTDQDKALSLYKRILAISSTTKMAALAYCGIGQIQLERKSTDSLQSFINCKKIHELNDFISIELIEAMQSTVTVLASTGEEKNALSIARSVIDLIKEAKESVDLQGKINELLFKEMIGYSFISELTLDLFRSEQDKELLNAAEKYAAKALSLLNNYYQEFQEIDADQMNHIMPLIAYSSASMKAMNNNMKDAITIINRTLELYPDSTDLLFAKAIFLFKESRFEEAADIVRNIDMDILEQVEFGEGERLSAELILYLAEEDKDIEKLKNIKHLEHLGQTAAQFDHTLITHLLTEAIIGTYTQYHYNEIDEQQEVKSILIDLWLKAASNFTNKKISVTNIAAIAKDIITHTTFDYEKQVFGEIFFKLSFLIDKTEAKRELLKLAGTYTNDEIKESILTNQFADIRESIATNGPEKKTLFKLEDITKSFESFYGISSKKQFFMSYNHYMNILTKKDDPKQIKKAITAATKAFEFAQAAQNQNTVDQTVYAISKLYAFAEVISDLYVAGSLDFSKDELIALKTFLYVLNDISEKTTAANPKINIEVTDRSKAGDLLSKTLVNEYFLFDRDAEGPYMELKKKVPDVLTLDLLKTCLLSAGEEQMDFLEPGDDSDLHDEYERIFDVLNSIIKDRAKKPACLQNLNTINKLITDNADILLSKLENNFKQAKKKAASLKHKPVAKPIKKTATKPDSKQKTADSQKKITTPQKTNTQKSLAKEGEELLSNKAWKKAEQKLNDALRLAPESKASLDIYLKLIDAQTIRNRNISMVLNTVEKAISVFEKHQTSLDKSTYDKYLLDLEKKHLELIQNGNKTNKHIIAVNIINKLLSVVTDKKELFDLNILAAEELRQSKGSSFDDINNHYRSAFAIFNNDNEDGSVSLYDGEKALLEMLSFSFLSDNPGAGIRNAQTGKDLQTENPDIIFLRDFFKSIETGRIYSTTDTSNASLMFHESFYIIESAKAAGLGNRQKALDLIMKNKPLSGKFKYTINAELAAILSEEALSSSNLELGQNALKLSLYTLAAKYGLTHTSTLAVKQSLKEKEVPEHAQKLFNRLFNIEEAFKHVEIASLPSADIESSAKDIATIIMEDLNEVLVAALAKDDLDLVRPIINVMIEKISSTKSRELAESVVRLLQDEAKKRYVPTEKEEKKSSALIMDNILINELKAMKDQKAIFSDSSFDKVYIYSSEKEQNKQNKDYLSTLGFDAAKIIFINDSVSENPENFSFLNSDILKHERVVVFRPEKYSRFFNAIRKAMKVTVDNKVRVVFADSLTGYKEFGETLAKIETVFNEELSTPERKVITDKAKRAIFYMLAKYKCAENISLFSPENMEDGTFRGETINFIDNLEEDAKNREMIAVFA